MVFSTCARSGAAFLPFTEKDARSEGPGGASACSQLVVFKALPINPKRALLLNGSQPSCYSKASESMVLVLGSLQHLAGQIREAGTCNHLGSFYPGFRTVVGSNVFP